MTQNDAPVREPYAVHPDACDYPDDKITCPYCLYEEREDLCECTSLRHDGDSTEFECPECDQVSKVTLHVTCEYSTEPIDPEVPRKAFEVMVSLEGGAAVSHTIYPGSAGINLVITALARAELDSNHFHDFVIEDQHGQVFRSTRSLVAQGVRPGHQLFIKRKASTP